MSSNSSQSAVGEDRAAIAILADRVAVVRRQDDVRAAQALAERGRAFAAKPLVADLGNLVDQVDVEIDRQAGAEREPRAHPGRIRVDRHVEIFAQLGKLLDEAERRVEAGAVNAGDEGDILAAAEGAVKGAAKAERKRHPGIAADAAAIGQLRARQQPDQGRLASPIGAKDPEIMARRERDRRILEHDFAPACGGVGLGDSVERDHSGALNLRRTARSSPSPPKSARIARLTR